MHPIEHLGDMGLVESLFFPFGAVLVSMQYRCMVCARRTVGLEIFLDAPNGATR
jgi:hypothetical protein